MTIKVAINGFGRIGRLFLRAALSNPAIEIVAINGVRDNAMSAHLLKHDSLYGALNHEVVPTENGIQVDDNLIRTYNIRDSFEFPWSEVGADVVLESTGKLREREKLEYHLKSGAKKVVVSAPAKGEDITIVMGVNEEDYDPAAHNIISNASCTTNCLAPVAKVIEENFGIVKGLMVTVHSYTNDQKILDANHKDLRRARAAAYSIIPTTTGAAKAVALVLPDLKGKLNGYALRVPTPTVSTVDLTVELAKEASVEEINSTLKAAAAQGPLKGVLGYTEEPLVSADFRGDSRSSIVDAGLTQAIGNMAKVVAWYDNEWGYTCRCVDMVAYIGQKGC
ncbi:MAG TPA: type I glyceraldehyde-3-phosphate dehydrogenase [Firmicutes bacterium]|jgi:glyceraldehyde 3-phosphate dehydrogenase|nr:type I glyceraldehyde-3-phosphate dehydrogenase [Bacillota bacterium]